MDATTNTVNLAYLIMCILVVGVTTFNTYITLNMKLEVAALKLEVERLLFQNCRKAEEDDKAVCSWVEEWFERSEIAENKYKNLEDRLNRCAFCGGKATP